MQPLCLALHLTFSFCPRTAQAGARTSFQSLHLTPLVFSSLQRRVSVSLKYGSKSRGYWGPARLQAVVITVCVFPDVMNSCVESIGVLAFFYCKLRLTSFKVNKAVSTSLCLHVKNFILPIFEGPRLYSELDYLSIHTSRWHATVDPHALFLLIINPWPICFIYILFFSCSYCFDISQRQLKFNSNLSVTFF